MSLLRHTFKDTGLTNEDPPKEICQADGRYLGSLPGGGFDIAVFGILVGIQRL